MKLVCNFMIIVALTLSVVGYAQESRTLKESDEITVVYDRTQATPDGFAFITVMATINSVLNQGDTELAMAMLQSGLSVSADEASVRLSQFLATYQEALSEAQLAVHTHACEAGGDPADVLGAMSGIRQVIYDRYYEALIAGFDDVTATRFANWIADEKSNLKVYSLDHRKNAQRRGIDLSEKVANLCGQ